MTKQTTLTSFARAPASRDPQMTPIASNSTSTPNSPLLDSFVDSVTPDLNGIINTPIVDPNPHIVVPNVEIADSAPRTHVPNINIDMPTIAMFDRPALHIGSEDWPDGIVAIIDEVAVRTASLECKCEQIDAKILALKRSVEHGELPTFLSTHIKTFNTLDGMEQSNFLEKLLAQHLEGLESSRLQVLTEIKNRERICNDKLHPSLVKAGLLLDPVEVKTYLDQQIAMTKFQFVEKQRKDQEKKDAKKAEFAALKEQMDKPSNVSSREFNKLCQALAKTEARLATLEKSGKVTGKSPSTRKPSPKKRAGGNKENRKKDGSKNGKKPSFAAKKNFHSKNGKSSANSRS